MRTLHLLITIAMLSISAVVFAADDPETMFTKYRCSSCHNADNKTIGPALKDIAAKYSADKEATAKLEKKVRSGGAGVWGPMPMPPTPAMVSDQDIKSLVTWVLSHK